MQTRFYITQSQRFQGQSFWGEVRGRTSVPPLMTTRYGIRLRANWVLYLALLIMGVSLFGVFGTAYGETRMAIVEGVGAVIGEDVARARDEALRDARRRAVEQAVGAFIQAETLMQNMQVVDDRILSKADGYVSDEIVLSERRDGSLYRIRIQAAVDTLTLENDLSFLIHRANNPQVMIAISELNMGRRPPFSIMEAELRKVFVAKGFHVVDAAQAEQNTLRDIAKGELGITDYEAAVTIAQRHRADVLIMGTAFTELKARTPLPDGSYAFSVQAWADIRAVNSQTAQVVASTSVTDQSYASSDRVAGSKAFEKVAGQTVEQIITGILKADPAARTIQLTVTGVGSFSLERKLSGELQLLRGTEGVYRRMWENGVAQYDIKTTGTVDDIAIRLESLTGLQVRVLSINLNEIRAEVSPY